MSSSPYSDADVEREAQRIEAEIRCAHRWECLNRAFVAFLVLAIVAAVVVLLRSFFVDVV